MTRASNNYVNDVNGNTTTGGGRANTWDSQNRLVQCVTGTGASQKTSSFTYGSDGLRRTMNVQTGNVPATAQYSETKYILDGQSVVQEQTRQKSGSGGTWTAWATVNYLMGPSGPLARLTATAADARWYCYDGLGSVLAEVYVDGSVTGTRKYDVYGATRNYTGTPLGRQAFVGQLGHATDDETGLTYMRARYYDNVTGRFISEDPAKRGDNWYNYCDGDSVNRVDKDGKAWSPPPFAVWVATGFLFLLGFAMVWAGIAGGGLVIILAVLLTIYDIVSTLGSFEDIVKALGGKMDQGGFRDAGGETVSQGMGTVNSAVALLYFNQLVEACLLAQIDEG